MIGLKDLIYKINHEENFEKAQGMLEMVNTIYDVNYGFLNRRVVRCDEHGLFHDVYSEL